MRKRYFWVISLILLVGVACGGADPTPAPAAAGLTPTSETAAEPPSPTATTAVPPSEPRTNPRVPVNVPIRYSTDLGFDVIRPVYEPHFAPADEIPLEDDELVLGAAWGGEAKAYPISVLRGREMVNDELAGIPTLVTW